jgi:putative ATP-binding cassette transporter
MRVTKNLTFFTSGYGQLALVFPLAVTAPAYFGGRVSLGVVFQASNAFVQVQTALSWIVDNYLVLTDWLATVERLSGFRREAVLASNSLTGSSIKAVESNETDMALAADVATPGGHRLLRDVKLRIPRGQWVFIQGPSGSGKTTLLRVFAAIWPFGSGTIELPSGSRLFLPQRPYVPLGTLKHAVCYPIRETTFSDLEVQEVLRVVGLAHLTTELDRVDPWDRRLSGGEKQRLAIARALLMRPDWLFLDEATANLDAEAEVEIHDLLRKRLPQTTVVAVAHNQESKRFYGSAVHLRCGGLHPLAT